MTQSIFCRALLLALAGAGAAQAAAQDRTPLHSISLERATDGLRPGQYVWRDSGYAELPVSVIVSLPLQMAFVYRGDTLIGAAAVSTGKKGKSTPVGDFTVLQKKVYHRSNLYSNAPMPYMQRLTWDGIALHAGVNPGYPASHGCIRLPHRFAVLLYQITSLGTQVGVVGEDGAPMAPASPIVIVADTDNWNSEQFAYATWGFEQVRQVDWSRFSGTGLAVSDGGWVVPQASLIPPE